ncbi:class I SAM-dependent methyltransferase [Archangium violaceum]|uniref:class I SAM-dependent methyltransferase n=1 Tax=Archangium violaceum TaxID=83451 RepID=UPI0036D9088A
MEPRHDQYEGVADSYDQTFKLLPYREHIEAFSLYRALGELSGLSVLDLACGTGIFTRVIRKWGAARVVGVDLSEDMVRVARSHEAASSLGIQYAVGDAVSLGGLGQFDCAVAIYLLGYMRSREELVQTGRGIARNLKPGGRFLTYFVNPGLSRSPGYYRKYGIDFFVPENVKDGELMHFTLTLGDTVTPKLSNTYWRLETVGSAFEEAGFTQVRWLQPELSEQGRARYGSAFWEDYLHHLPGIFLDCRKAE